MTSRARVAMVGGLLGLALAGCGAGQDAATSQDQPSIPGVNVQEAGVAVRNARVPFDPDGYQPGDTAPVLLGVFNQNDEPVRLVEVTSTGATSVAVPGGAVLEVPAYGYVDSTLELTGLRAPLDGAGAVALELVFDNGVSFAIEVPVAPPAERVGSREPLPLDEEH